MADCNKKSSLLEQVEKMQICMQQICMFTNGSETQQVELGGELTDTLRKLVNDFNTYVNSQKFMQDIVQAAQYWAQQANTIATSEAFIATGGTEARTLADRAADEVNVKDFGAKGDGVTDDTASIQSACNTGKSVFAPLGRYRISKMFYLIKEGQIFRGAGPEQTIIFNDVNDEPLFLPGNPNAADQVAQFGAIKDLSLHGNKNGATLWGIFSPCAPYVSGSTPHPSAIYEGWMLSDPRNYYYGKVSFPTTDWSIPARGFNIENVRVRYVYGGYGVHTSAWCWLYENLQIWTGLQGIRVSGAVNSCKTDNLYISGMTKEGIMLPQVSNSQPTDMMFVNSVVQSCGAYEGGNASIAVLKGTSVVIDGLYTEKNNIRGATRDIFVGVNAVNTRIDNLFTTVNESSPYPTWSVIETQGTGTSIGDIYQRDQVGAFVTVSGSDSRTATVFKNSRFAYGIAAPTAYIDNKYTGASIGSVTGSINTLPGTGNFVALMAERQGLFSASGKLILRNTASTANVMEIQTAGDFNICANAPGASTSAGAIKFIYGGDSLSGRILAQFNAAANGFLPGKDNDLNIGQANLRMAQIFAANGTINTSDARHKTDIVDVDEALLRAWGKVRFRTFRFKDSVAEKGDRARIHIGLVAQEVDKAFASEGLRASDFAFFCFDSWPDTSPIIESVEEVIKPVAYDMDGNLLEPEVMGTREVEIVPAQKGGEIYGIRYEEALALECAYQRWRLDRIERLLGGAEI